MWTTEKLSEHYDQQRKQWRAGIKARGRQELIDHFSGKKLSKQQSISAHCYECMGGHADGISRDCSNPPCPLYPHNPHNPDKVKKTISPEHVEIMAQSRRKEAEKV